MTSDSADAGFFGFDRLGTAVTGRDWTTKISPPPPPRGMAHS
ncbi:MAG: hypothetical protein QOH87_4903, partial [Trebonia sp.]|nr:hypothetical protein [Trebonia sp.]